MFLTVYFLFKSLFRDYDEINVSIVVLFTYQKIFYLLSHSECLGSLIFKFRKIYIFFIFFKSIFFKCNNILADWKFKPSNETLEWGLCFLW